MDRAVAGWHGSQAGASVRFDWGQSGASAVIEGCDVAVVVDVLSFTTTLTIAADREVQVVPCAWNDERAEAIAREHGAVLAVGRSQAGPGQVSLSPASVRQAVDLRRLVLPSPNGSTISAALADRGVDVVGASLRNRHAVASWLSERRRTRPDLAVALIAAGERRSDGTLRPAAEDLWGAGAVIAGLVAGGVDGPLTRGPHGSLGVLDDRRRPPDRSARVRQRAGTARARVPRRRGRRSRTRPERSVPRLTGGVFISESR